jgi:GNAT superfamily N-acetyltransferase
MLATNGPRAAQSAVQNQSDDFARSFAFILAETFPEAFRFHIGALLRTLRSKIRICHGVKMAAIEIRMAEIGDAERIATLITELAMKFVLRDFSAEGKSRFLADHTSAAAADRLRAGFRYRVAEFGGELVGVAGVRDWAHLYHLFVAEAFQGQGLGRSLWEQIKAECLERGNPGRFTVNSSINAVRVYERFGFAATGPVQTVGGIRFVPMELDARGTCSPR